MELLQIVPMLPPAVSGVGDYALLLARELLVGHGVRTHFLCGDPGWRGQEENVAPFPGEAVADHSVPALLAGLKNAASCQAVLLHYVGHGYEKRGCPFWLVRALEHWKHRNGDTRLIVLFHEVSGSGPVWTSGFWTAGIQTSLAQRLARLGDSLRITTEVAAKRVRAMLPAGSGKPVRVQPVFSTLGEIATPLPYHERTRQMIVFGGVGWRRAAYTRHRETLEDVCQRLRIEKVIDIGVPVGLRPNLSVPFVEAGVLPAGEASELLSRSSTGFFTYPVLHIGKSTIFAAYCAHGLLPVTFAENALPGDAGLSPAKHFLAGTSWISCDEATLTGIAASAHLWYQQHRLREHARGIHDSLLQPEPIATPASF